MKKTIYPTQYTTDELLEQKLRVLQNDAKRVVCLVSGQNPLNSPPVWFDEQRFSRAQQIAQTCRLSLEIASLYGVVIWALIPNFCVQFLSTDNFRTPYKTMMRLLSTLKTADIWYTGNPYDKSSAIHASLNRIRGYHLQLTHLLHSKYPDKKNIHPCLDDENVWLSQFDMVLSVWGMIGTLITIPNQCAFYVARCLGKCREEALTLQKEYQGQEEMPILVAEQTASGVQIYFKMVTDQTIETSQHRLPLKTKVSQKDAQQLFALQELMYFWRVLGHCLGVDDKFNSLDEKCIARNVTYNLMIFDQINRPVLENPNEIALIGLQGLHDFTLIFNCVIPKFMVSYESCFKYLYEALRLPHPFQMDTFPKKFSYFCATLGLDWALRIKFLYYLTSKIYFKSLPFVVRRFKSKERMINKRYGHLRFQICDINGNLIEVEFKGYKPYV